MNATRTTAEKGKSGKLRIGDNWNAITIIALSQTNSLEAVAEFVENSVDAHARNITITRGRERGDHYLRIMDDGEGTPQHSDGVPNVQCVATHICDSIKRQLKVDGMKGIQGEFGIGLLSFWTVGEELTMTAAGADGVTYQMQMRKGDPEGLAITDVGSGDDQEEEPSTQGVQRQFFDYAGRCSVFASRLNRASYRWEN